MAPATYGHLANLTLADPPDGEVESKIDILIGVDFYWSFVTDRIIMGKSGPVAVQTSLGWVLSGRMEKGRGLPSKHTLVTHVFTARNRGRSEAG